MAAGSAGGTAIVTMSRTRTITVFAGCFNTTTPSSYISTFFFRFSAQWQVSGTSLCMPFDTVASLSGSVMYTNYPLSSSLMFYIVVFHFASFLLFFLQEYLLTVYHHGLPLCLSFSVYYLQFTLPRSFIHSKELD